jgi:hypothetical protein
MRILMLQPAAGDQHSRVGERRDHRIVGVALVPLVVQNALTLKSRRITGERPIGIDGVGNRRVDAALLQLAPVLHPDIEILPAVARRGMDKAGASLLGDMVAPQERHVEPIATEPGIAQRMRTNQRGEVLGRDVSEARVAVTRAWPITSAASASASTSRSPGFAQFSSGAPVTS